MADIRSIHLKLCSLALFRDLLRAPLISSFMDLARQTNNEGKRLAYGEFVASIYLGGGSLTECVRKLVFESENVYVKTVSLAKERHEAVPEVMRAACDSELKTLSALASITYSEMLEYISPLADEVLPAFSSEKADLVAEYSDRIKNIERYGYGIFVSHGMFRINSEGDIVPIESADNIGLDKFIGYELERKKIFDNTVAFLEGRPAANALLYGDAGTGKSSTVKAIANNLFDRGIRLIEVRKDQLFRLPRIMGKISASPLKFIIFIDDLSFNKNDDTFSMLKATLEGSASAKAKNAVIYATSNRRHIVKESFSDRDGGDVHRNDTIQETLSLSERFGLTVLFAKPEKKLYLEIISQLAARHGIEITDEILRAAEEFALRRGYRSARCAEQFIDSLL